MKKRLIAFIIIAIAMCSGLLASKARINNVLFFPYDQNDWTAGCRVRQEGYTATNMGFQLSYATIAAGSPCVYITVKTIDN
ncbi:hypothetical protein [Chitinophaga qingshengii]|uniref:Uncharacterized protein n=1 Tax=Chitinophaga qingshengii TaxID=1569794 RepID=A0ABR7TMQ0_9BACT|nr:hypothetical protein [Chitinophaga qingshengii]MBC9931763.1 hypothetical protein [Chitinophaga qingshengii]